MSSPRCLRFYVSGRVQGVWFRASTRDHAKLLGLTGYARNLADGRVEVLACGERSALGSLEEWLRQGPPGASVSEVVSEEADETPPEGFTTG